jgi:hypothetical protein
MTGNRPSISTNTDRARHLGANALACKPGLGAVHYKDVSLDSNWAKERRVWIHTFGYRDRGGRKS